MDIKVEISYVYDLKQAYPDLDLIAEIEKKVEGIANVINEKYSKAEKK